MAGKVKPLKLTSKHLTKDEKQAREEAEARLKVDDTEVYKCPETLTTDEEKALYDTLVNNFKASGILCDLDIYLLEQTVISIIGMRDCQYAIRKEGVITNDGKKNPAITAYKDFNGIFNNCCNQLGLSPQSRAKLGNINLDAIKVEQDPVNKALKGE